MGNSIAPNADLIGVFGIFWESRDRIFKCLCIGNSRDGHRVDETCSPRGVTSWAHSVTKRNFVAFDDDFAAFWIDGLATCGYYEDMHNCAAIR